MEVVTFDLVNRVDEIGVSPAGMSEPVPFPLEFARLWTFDITGS